MRRALYTDGGEMATRLAFLPHAGPPDGRAEGVAYPNWGTDHSPIGVPTVPQLGDNLGWGLAGF